MIKLIIKRIEMPSLPKRGYLVRYLGRSFFVGAAFVILLGGGLVGTSSALAQVVTPQQGNVQVIAAEENRRRLDEQDSLLSSKQTGSGVVTDPISRRELPPRGGATVLLRSINVGPDSAFLTQTELDKITAKYLGKRVDFSQISELVRDVNDLYAEKGIVTAAAILPPQNLNAGNLQVRLVEGQLGNVALVGDHLSKNEFILNRIRLAKGTTVDVPTAGKDIARFNATSRAQLRLLLQPGVTFGYTDVLLGITEPKKNEFQVYLDNEGAASTGKWQMSTLLRRYGLLGIDDTFLAYASISDGSRSVTGRYEFPIGTYGTRLAASVTASDIKVVSGPTAILNITGKSKSADLTLSHPLFISDKWTLVGTASAFLGSSASYSGSVSLVDSKTTKYAPGIVLSYRGDKGSVSSQIQGLFAESTDNVAGTNRDVFLFAGSISGQYRFDNGLTFIGRGAGQHANANLLPGDFLFQIGGPNTVRGYPSDGIAGDSGFYGNLELHKQFSVRNKSFDGYVFTDFGEVYSTFPKSTTLISAGFGVDYSIRKHARASFSVASPLKLSLTNQSDFVVSGMLTLSAY